MTQWDLLGHLTLIGRKNSPDLLWCSLITNISSKKNNLQGLGFSKLLNVRFPEIGETNKERQIKTQISRQIKTQISRNRRNK